MTEQTAPVVTPRRAGNLLNILVAVAALLAAGGIAFAAGRVTAPATTAAGADARAGNGNGRFFGPNGSFAPGTGGGGGFGGGLGAAFGSANLSIKGTVTDVTSSSITLQLASGGTITLGVNGATTYHQQQDASSSNVTKGQDVIVQVAGRGGNGGGARPGGSAAPGSSAAPGASGGALTGTATDVTLAAP